MARRKKQIIDAITITDFAAEGKCIAKLDNQVIFVPGADIAPGDVVKLVIKRKRKSFSEGHILEVLEKSKDRVDPFCEHFGVCGGCKWQHISYEDQLKQKQRQVLDQLKRIGRIDISDANDILPSVNTTYYRNKLEYTFSTSLWLSTEQIQSGQVFEEGGLGFHAPGRYDKIVPIKHCHLQGSISNDLRNFLAQFAKDNDLELYNHKTKVGFLRTLMIRTASTGEVMVAIQFAENDQDKIKLVTEALSSKFKEITSFFYFINTKGNDSYFDLEPILVTGQAFIMEEMEGLNFKIGPKSFYQTNSEQAYELYKIAREYAEIEENDIVYDLYTGTGTIANFVAKSAKKVVGVEYIKEAIDDAFENSKNNNIDNTSFYAGDLKKVLTDDLFQKEGFPDVIITDPPRAGMDPEVVAQILKSKAKTIVYVSCNAATQARDLQLLAEKYQVEAIQPVDMFPHTHHVENVVKLSLK